MEFFYLTSPFFLQCYKPSSNSFKIVFDLRQLSILTSQNKNMFYKEKTRVHLELKETKNAH